LEKPVTIQARKVELSPTVEALIREQASQLERYYPDLIGCAVVVEGPGNHHKSGGPYQVRIDLRVPGAEPLIISRQAAEDLQAAVRESFHAAVRRLQDFAHLQRGEVKAH
jgi:ribosome-associated translation inhibitor RaiA